MALCAVDQTLRGARCLELDSRTAKRLVGILMRASGASGMVGGQMMDLEGEGSIGPGRPHALMTAG